jgi:hypothetical protein
MMKNRDYYYYICPCGEKNDSGASRSRVEIENSGH